MRPHSVWAVLVFVCVLAGSGIAAAGVLEVAPTTVRLTPGTGNVVYVANHGAEPVVVQIEAFDWSQSGGKDVLAPSETLLLSPPMARLEPGGQQTVRLMVPGNAASDGERTYRLVVSQLPDPSAGAGQQVRFLLQFSVPVFVNEPGDEASALTWNAAVTPAGLTITAHNNGRRHAKLTGLRVSAPGKPAVAFDNGLSYVLPGSDHSWTIAAAGHQPGDKLQIEGQDETSSAAVHASVDVKR